MLLRVLLQVLRDPNPGQAQSLLLSLPDVLLLSIPALLLSLTCHEASHAWVANRLGDPTAKLAGRVSLNPFRHLDRVGTLMLLVVGFGWGRPVPIDPDKLRFGPAKGAALVGLAGPVTNLVLATLFALPVRLGIVKWHAPPQYVTPFLIPDAGYVAADILGYFIMFNVLLAAFNLIPIAPLDGSRLIGFILPNRLWPWLLRYEVLGILIAGPLIIVVTLFDLVTGGSHVFQFIEPLANVVSRIAVGRPLT